MCSGQTAAYSDIVTTTLLELLILSGAWAKVQQLRALATLADNPGLVLGSLHLQGR